MMHATNAGRPISDLRIALCLLEPARRYSAVLEIVNYQPPEIVATTYHGPYDSASGTARWEVHPKLLTALPFITEGEKYYGGVDQNSRKLTEGGERLAFFAKKSLDVDAQLHFEYNLGKCGIGSAYIPGYSRTQLPLYLLHCPNDRDKMECLMPLDSKEDPMDTWDKLNRIIGEVDALRRKELYLHLEGAP